MENIPAKILLEEKIQTDANEVFGVAGSLMGQAYPEFHKSVSAKFSLAQSSILTFRTEGIIATVGTVVDIVLMHWHTPICDAVSSLYPTSFFSAPDPEQF